MPLIALAVLFAGCASGRPALVPVPTIAHAARPTARASTLIVLLPGKGSRAGDFQHNGFIDSARERGMDADFVEADLCFSYYEEGTDAKRLWEDVVTPARTAGYERLWLVGISLGGSGAIRFAREHPDAVAGLVLLSPWLGPPEASVPIRAAGGLAAWTPEPQAAAGPFASLVLGNWEFLKSVSATGGRRPTLYLGYGLDEPMGPSLDVLAASLPADHVVHVPGSHRWKTWRALWNEMLLRHVFDATRAGA
jgi:pimeloyl-ACP methyl ester carboxylesterase